MNPPALFGLSIVLGFIAWGLVAKCYIWPAVRRQPGRNGFRPILLLHSFRFIGLGFLIPGVVAPELPAEFAVPAAYGDLLAAVLALLALLALETPIGLPLVWIFNVCGTADLLHAYYQGRFGVGVQPGDLGAMYFVPTVFVPLLLVTHFLVFRMLLMTARKGA